MLFSDLRLSEPLLRAVASEGYSTATPIQALAIPPGLEGRDVLGSAQTGTGKTAAFALPILQRLSAASNGHAPQPRAAGHAPNHSPNHSSNHASSHPAAGKSKSTAPRCLVLCPTRELATQIGEGFRVYGKNLHLRHTVIFGGASMNQQIQALRRGVDIIVATPGRLLDLMNQRMVDLRSIEVLVLDEADRMLDMGFIHDIRRVVAQLPPQRQTMLFSATMPREIRSLADSLLRDPAVVQVAPQSTLADKIDQFVYFVDRRNKPALLAHLVNFLPMTRAIVFSRTKHGADRVVRQLHSRGIRAEAIHGNKAQNARQRALENFRIGKIPVLVATDIASRGIDIDGITHVVNYDLTHEPETYVHRIGRTARAGAAGAAVSFCDAEERPNLKAIERLLRCAIPVKTDHPDYASLPVPAEESHHPRGASHRDQQGARRSESRRDQRSSSPTRPAHPRQGPQAHSHSASQAPSHNAKPHVPHAPHAPKHVARHAAAASSTPASKHLGKHAAPPARQHSEAPRPMAHSPKPHRASHAAPRPHAKPGHPASAPHARRGSAPSHRAGRPAGRNKRSW